ncbi:MAG: class I SAM-dependent methyltransferase [Caldilineales bacterium]
MFSKLRAVNLLGPTLAARIGKSKELSNSTIRGYYATQVLIALIDVGFIDALAAGDTISVGSFARSENLDATILQSLCDYAYELGYLDRRDPGYMLSQKGVLVNELIKGALLSVHAYADIFNNLDSLLRGESAYGVNITRKSKYVAIGSGYSAQVLAIPVLSRLLLEHKRTRILDLACGDATFLVNMCASSPQFSGYGVDIAPEAVEAGNQQLAARGFKDRVQLVVADMFAMDGSFGEVGAIDATTCVYALHEFLSDDNERLMSLLRKYRTRFPGVPLVVCEVIRHSPAELRSKPGGVMEIQLLHDLSNQRLATRGEWQEIFRQAGFANVDETYLDFARTAVFVAG